MELWKWAFRNLFRQKRRTLLNVLTLSLGMMLLFNGLGWIGGYDAFLFKGIQDFDTGQVQLMTSKYYEAQRRLPLDSLIANYSSLHSEILTLPQVRAASGRLDFMATVSAKGHREHLVARAVNFEQEKKLTVLSQQIQQGIYPQDKGFLLGQGIAKRWGLHPGDTVYLTAFDQQGAENFIVLKITGLFSFGYSPLDDHMVFLDLPTAWSLLGSPQQVGSIAIRLKGIEALQWVHEHNTLSGALFYPWQDFAKTTVDAVKADEDSFVFLLAVVYILATLGMLNSLSLSIHERRRELGTLRALGMRRNRLEGLILREGIALALLSLIVAAFLSVPLVVFLGIEGLDLKPYLPPSLPFPFGDRFYAVYHLSSFLITVSGGLIAGVLGAWIPARRAGKSRIIEIPLS